MKIIDRYILKSLAGPFFFSFFTILFVLILQFYATFSERFIGRGIGFSAVFELLLLQSAWMVGLAAPMAVLIAVVMVFGTLTMTSEMTVLRSSGISLFRLMIPVLGVGLLLSALVERFNNIVLPRANYYSQQLLTDMARAKPAFGLTEGAFSTLVEGYSILVRKVDDRSKELQGIVIYDTSRPQFSTMVTAEKGRLEFSSDNHYLVMTLFNGELSQVRNPDHRVLRNMTFRKHRFVFESSGFGFSRSAPGKMRSGDGELSASELLLIGREFKKRIAESAKRIGMPLDTLEQRLASGAFVKGGRGSAESYVDGQLVLIDGELKAIKENRQLYNRYMAAYYKKYSLSLACFVFVLVGAPLGVLARRGGFGIGAGMSLLFFVLYWALMISGEKIAERGLLDPMISMWLPNLVMTAIGTLLIVRLTGAVLATSR
ncbi:MAG: LptF/LptG family permease [Chlorobiaceae bacterium]